MNYNSKTIIAHTISSVSNKAVYLVNPTSLDGTIYENVWIAKSWVDKEAQERVFIDWDYAVPSFVEVPMSQITPSMFIDKYYNDNSTRINCRLVDGKVQEFLQLEERFELQIPTWMLAKWTVKLKPMSQLEIAKGNHEFQNDESFFTVAETTARNSFSNITLLDRDSDDLLDSPSQLTIF